MYNDGAVKTYTESAMDTPRIIVTEEVIW